MARNEGDAMTAASGFPGFRAAAFEFLDSLRANNDPAWFKPRKAIYEAEVLAPLRDLIVAVADALREADLPLTGDPKHAIFRICRDVRFSPDKRPYKTHAGALLTRSSGKRDPGLLYLHLALAPRSSPRGFGTRSPTASPDCAAPFSQIPTVSWNWLRISSAPATRSPATSG
jgi:uncharacterized protein (TIGR02453 family)